MNIIKFYRIATYILIPIGALIGLFTLFTLIAALLNLILLPVVLMMATMVVYIVLSCIFLFKGIDSNRLCKYGTKRWLSNTAFISGGFGVLSIVNGAQIISTGFLKKLETVNELLNAQKTALPPGISNTQMVEFVNIFGWIMLIWGIFFLIHIILSIRLLKIFAHLFEQPQEPQA